MKTITKEDVEKGALLGRVGLTHEELADFTKKLADILGYFSAIQKIDTEGVATADDVSGLTNVAREDMAVQLLCTPQDLLQRAPSVHKNHIQVPTVFE